MIIFNNASADFVLISADALLKIITILKELRITQLCSKNGRTLGLFQKSKIILNFIYRLYGARTSKILVRDRVSSAEKAFRRGAAQQKAGVSTRVSIECKKRILQKLARETSLGHIVKHIKCFDRFFVQNTRLKNRLPKLYHYKSKTVTKTSNQFCQFFITKKLVLKIKK